MKRWHLWLATALLALLTGCASGPRYSDVYQNIPPPAEDQGRILFYRSSVLGAAVQPDLRLDGNVVGSFSPRGFFYVDRPLGRYTAQARTEVEARLDIDVIPQRTSYVEMSIGIGFLVGQPRLKLRTPVEALPELNDLAYIGKQAPVSPAASPPVMAASTSAPVSTAQATVTSAPDRVPNSGTADAVPSQTAAPASNFPTGIPHVIEYRLDDRMGGPPRNVSFRFLEQVDGRVSFNNGTWIESPDGAVIESNSQIAGDFDTAMPPGGWVPKANDLTPGASWLSRYSRKSGGGRTDMDVTAVVGGKETLVIAGRALPAVRVDYRGYTTRIGNSVASSQNQTGKYEATAWYSPELRRVVRFAAKTRGGIGGGTFVVDEELNLVSMR